MLKKIRQCLEKAPGCKVVDETKDGGYITPAESSGDFVTYISRIRDDQTQKKFYKYVGCFRQFTQGCGS